MTPEHRELDDAMADFIENAHLLTAHFGRWPSFHDAEVLQVTLTRTPAPPSMLWKVLVLKVSQETDAAGHFKLTRECIVTFECLGLQEVHLTGFNEQNVVFGIRFEKAENGLRIAIETCYGLDGEVTCKRIRIVSVEPVASVAINKEFEEK